MLTRTLHRRRILLGAFIFMFGFTVGRHLMARIHRHCTRRIAELEESMWLEFGIENFKPDNPTLKAKVKAASNRLRPQEMRKTKHVTTMQATGLNQIVKNPYKLSGPRPTPLLQEQTPQSMLIQQVLGDPAMPRNCLVCDFPLKTDVISQPTIHGTLDWRIISACWGPDHHTWETLINISNMMAHQARHGTLSSTGMQDSIAVLLRGAVKRHIFDLRAAKALTPTDPQSIITD